MKLVRHISTLLRYVAILLAGVYWLTCIYMIISVVFRLPSFALQPENRFVIYYPFTQVRFLLGSNFTFNYVAEMSLVMLLYGLFFYLLANVFKAFRQKKLFTQYGIRQLKFFYLYNFIHPLILVLAFNFFATGEDYPAGFIVMAHFIIGIFAYFIMAIFKEGAGLQNEQDLFI